MVTVVESANDQNKVLYFSSFVEIQDLLRYDYFEMIQDAYTSTSFMVLE